MSNKAIKAKAEELLSFGIPKQQVFDNLMLEFPEAKPKKVAEVVRYMPSQWSKERYRSVHLSLLALIAASALLRILEPLLNDGIRMDMPTAYLSLVPIASLLMGYSIYRWQGEVFGWVGWGNVFGFTGLVSALGALAKGQGDVKVILASAFTAGIGALALYLANKVFAKPQMLKDPQGLAPTRFIFADEVLG
ncbi:MAG TPA: hypothetical protein PLB89_15605 [Flavobacteriales bacterium]|nr:hypothetical protein [Flavobacteriales bacterium]